MTYEKPEIRELGSAVDAVQGLMLKDDNPIDNHQQSVSAYESDE